MEGDDDEGKTLLSLSTLSPEVKNEISYGGNINAAEVTGKLLNKKLKEKGVSVVFDRNGYLFHGRIKSLADQIELKKKNKYFTYLKLVLFEVIYINL